MTALDNSSSLKGRFPLFLPQSFLYLSGEGGDGETLWSNETPSPREAGVGHSGPREVSDAPERPARPAGAPSAADL